MMVDLTTGNPLKRVFYLGLPMLVGNLFQLIYNVTDMFVLGWFADPTAIASVGVGFPILFLVISVTMGLCIGISIMISQYFGAGKFKELKNVVGTSFILMILMAVVGTVLGIAVSGPILELLKTPASILSGAKTYLYIIFGGLIFIMYYNVYAAFLRGLGNSITPLYFLIFACVVNVFLDFLLIGAFKMGVAGAAIATIISEGLASILCVVYVYYRVPLLAVKFKDMRVHRHLIKPMIRYSVPPALQQGISALGIIAVQGVVNSFGVAVIAAYVIGSRIDSFMMMIAMSFSAALSTFAAQNIGAGFLKRLRIGYIHTLIMVSVILGVLGVLVYIAPSFIVGLFIPYDEEVFKYAGMYLSVVPLFYIAAGVMFCTMGVLRGAGDTISAMVISIIGMSLNIFLIYAMAYPSKAQQVLEEYHIGFLNYIVRLMPDLGVGAIWYSIAATWCAASLMLVLRYLSNRWIKYSLIGAKK